MGAEGDTSGREVRVLDDHVALARAAADEWRLRALAAVAASGRFAVALSGGATPRAVYALLADPAAPYRDALPWARTHVFFGDERAVPPDDPRSNYGMARGALLSSVALPPENVHRIRGEDEPGAAARSYEDALRAFFGVAPRFDLLLLGMGADGHTASLFPGSPAIDEPSRLVAAVPAPAAGPARITLTLRALQAAARAVFLVSGAQKAPALARVLSGASGAEALPAARVRPAHGSVLWLVDRAAAPFLPAP
ncbi:6-phosphogluconolactonase [Anaeromyxobacter sp. SG17]|uniref:6-phosphogluconolactonase n=1 Tax=Anaeromyxobacter sp. SG17 TaxID=2925405 RepID=UPI001F5687A0|nr:6-phosphogluconolactonase [Anaeromyxobacter sp. SG17]